MACIHDWLYRREPFTRTCCWGLGRPASSCRNQGSSYTFPCRDTRWRALGGSSPDMSQGKPGPGRNPPHQHQFARMEEGKRKKNYEDMQEDPVIQEKEKNWFFFFTMTNEYPLHRDSQSRGHSGVRVVWLWTAITLEVVSHTEHLNRMST